MVAMQTYRQSFKASAEWNLRNRKKNTGLDVIEVDKNKDLVTFGEKKRKEKTAKALMANRYEIQPRKQNRSTR